MQAVTDFMNRAGALFRAAVPVFLLSAPDVLQAQAITPSLAEARTHVTVFRAQIVIARPVKEVWPIFLAMEDWMLNVRFERVAGEAGAVGERRKVSAAGTQKDDGFYYIETVLVAPRERYVVKVAPGSGTSFDGFAAFSFMDNGASTLMTYDIYVNSTAPPMDDRQFAEYSRERARRTKQAVEANNENLKKIVEARGAE